MRSFHFALATVTAGALAPFITQAQTVGNAVVLNHCPSDIYAWSVGSSIGPSQTIVSGQNYSETYHRDPVSGGTTIKLTRQPEGLTNGSPQMQFAYSLTNDSIWYDLSDVFGDPFNGDSVDLQPSDNSCLPITWPAGVPPSGPDKVGVCGSTANVVLTVC
jgi:Blastomyces yeast-phase-specific protein